MDLDLHAFEPSAYMFERLEATLHGQQASLQRMALSDRAGSSLLHVRAPGVGMNSLHALPGVPAGGPAEQVTTVTLGSYGVRAGLDQLTLVKIDTESHDLAVLRKAREFFRQSAHSVAQFEYNHRWAYARCYLRDAFELVEPLGYQVGKFTSAGVEFLPSSAPRWRPS